MPFDIPVLSVLDFAFIAGLLVVMHVARRWGLLYALACLRWLTGNSRHRGRSGR